nr:cell number regulator 9-like [Coffea arabica]
MASGNIGNDWSSGLCDCIKDCRSCCLTCWCPCITFGRVAEIVDKGQSSCCKMGCIFCVLNLLLLNHGSLSWIISMGYRTKIRQQYGIMGGSCEDCVLHFFCGRCALCQEYRELQFQGYDVGAGWEANAAKKAYGVTMAPVGEKMTR